MQACLPMDGCWYDVIIHFIIFCIQIGGSLWC
jgi:hypothetical protein